MAKVKIVFTRPKNPPAYAKEYNWGEKMVCEKIWTSIKKLIPDKRPGLWKYASE